MNNEEIKEHIKQIQDNTYKILSQIHSGATDAEVVFSLAFHIEMQARQIKQIAQGVSMKQPTS